MTEQNPHPGWQHPDATRLHNERNPHPGWQHPDATRLHNERNPHPGWQHPDGRSLHPAAAPPPSYLPPMPATPAPARRPSPMIIGAVAAGAVALFAAGWLSGFGYASGSTPTTGDGPLNTVTNIVNGRNSAATLLHQARERCDTPHAGTTIGDGGYTLTIDEMGDDDHTGLTGDAVTCILDHLKIPESVRARIGQTRTLDGRQNDTFGAFTMSWTYHPDNGINMIIEVV